jgi:hypothetical protein
VYVFRLRRHLFGAHTNALQTSLGRQRLTASVLYNNEQYEQHNSNSNNDVQLTTSQGQHLLQKQNHGTITVLRT